METDDKKSFKDSQAVESVIGVIISDEERVKARSENESAFFAIRASSAAGYDEPMTAEQRALNTMLIELKAGKDCCEQAWKLYHELTS
ncbi:hypothetical protein N9M10_01660 [Hellea sp.]|nr:hypothetical protein [Hellea sp.]